MRAGNDNQSVDILMLGLGLIIGIAIFGIFSLTDFGGTPNNEALDAAEKQGSAELVPLDQMTTFKFGRGAAGFFVSNDGCIVTNHHVVSDLVLEEQEFARVYLPIDSDTNYYFAYAEIIKTGSHFGSGWDGNVHEDDLAVLKLDINFPIYTFDENLNEVEVDVDFQINPITININDIDIAEAAFAVGHPQPLGEWLPIHGPYVGDLAAYDENGELIFDFNEHLFDLMTFPGNSGGPILNLNGELIGVVWGGTYDMTYSNWMDDVGFEEDDFFWYFPIDSTNPFADITATREEIQSWIDEGIKNHPELVLTASNIGYYLEFVGYYSTAAEKATTVVEFLEDTPCKINTSTEKPISYYRAELDNEGLISNPRTEVELSQEVEQIGKLFNDKVKYQVVAIDVVPESWYMADAPVSEEMRSSFGTLNTNIAILFTALISSVILIYKRRR